MKTFFKLFVTTYCLFFSSLLHAQDIKYNKEEYSIKPLWIEMIDDTSANYYEAIIAFDTYWKGKLKPQQEVDAIEENLDKKEERARERFEKKLSKLPASQREEYNKMTYECKRFENWKREQRKYVQEDGSILTYNQRLAIWNKQQEEIKLQQK